MREQHMSHDMREDQGQINKIASWFNQHAILQSSAKQANQQLGGL
jgi:hypothetical protein